MMKGNVSRRGFLAGAAAGAASLGFPALIPAGVLGAGAPSKKIQVGLIGCGRIAAGMDIPGLAQNADLATLVALSDCDRVRMAGMARKAEGLFGKENLPVLSQSQDYHELLANPAVDAVMICTPDFCHAEICVAAALAGKDVYVQKPLTMSVYEGRKIVDVFAKTSRVFHIGSQQRSEGPSTFGPQFRKAVEYVRDGRIGKVLRIEVGLPRDPDEPSDWPLSEPVPPTFDYDRWQGRTPLAPYCRLRTHPQGKNGQPDFNGRPGWMTIQRYDMGMISNWGAHHLDIVQWALDAEASGPVAVVGSAEFPQRRLWDTHGKLDVTLTYASGTLVRIADESVYPNGVRFIGDKGWIFCSRGSAKAPPGDPVAAKRHGRWRPLDASDPALITGEVARPVVRNPLGHHRVWLQSILSRKPTNITPEAAHRSTTACILAYTAMNLKRPLKWDPAAERFIGDPDADKTLSLPERAPYGVRNALLRAGWKA
jgi:myo-inositol 2-dehydrogenase/D-chiro-inositol 1-dehydrogenase